MRKSDKPAKKGKLNKEQEEAEIRRRIDEDRDFIYSPSHNNSLKAYMRNRGYVPDNTIAKLLRITEEQVEIDYQSGIIKIRKELGLTDSDLHRGEKQINRELLVKMFVQNSEKE